MSKFKPWERLKKSPYMKQIVSKEEAMKIVLYKEILAALKTDGRLRDDVRRALEALPPWTPFEDVTADLSSPMARKMGIDDPKVLLKMQELLGIGGMGTRAFQNSRYFVHRTPTENGGFILSIRNITNDARHDWREFQRIKNELCGDEYEAIELYPAESRLVDTSNQFYCHVIPEGMLVPVGFGERLVMKPRLSDDVSGTNQRAWETGDEPVDAIDAPSTELDQMMYRQAVQAMAKENTSGEDTESESDCVVPASGGVHERPEQHECGSPHLPGGQPGERGQAGEGQGSIRQDHAEAAGANPEGDRQVRGEHRQAVAEDQEEGVQAGTAG